MAFQVVLDDTKAVLPERKHGSIGYDVRSVEKMSIVPGNRATISTGLRIAFPDGHYCRIAPRSGLAFHSGIDVLAGVVDSDYRGIVRVILHNTGSEVFEVNVGDRIAQLILEQASVFDVQCVESVEELGVTSRGDGGFGSTGVK